MYSLAFVVLCFTFGVLVVKALTSGVVAARGWGTAIDHVDRRTRPVAYWLNVVLYASLSGLSLVMSLATLDR